MFISLAARRSLCFSSIFFVALFVRLSWNMNVFLDSSPVPSKASLSSLGAAPDVAPVSRIQDLGDHLLASFCAQCAENLLAWPVTVVAVMAMSTLV